MNRMLEVRERGGCDDRWVQRCRLLGQEDGRKSGSVEGDTQNSYAAIRAVRCLSETEVEVLSRQLDVLS